MDKESKKLLEDVISLQSLFLELINTETWIGTQKFLEKYQSVFLKEDTLTKFDQWVAMSANQSWSWYSTVLRNCFKNGIQSTFEKLPEPRPINKALKAALYSNLLFSLTDIIDTFPEMISDHFIENLLLSLPNVHEEKRRRKLQEVLANIRLIRSAQLPINEDILQELHQWFQSRSPQASYDYLVSKRSALVSQEAIDTLYAIKLQCLINPEIYTRLETHYTLLKLAYEQSIDIAYVGLLKKKEILKLLCAKMSETSSQIIKQFLEATNIFEASYIVRDDIYLFNSFLLIMKETLNKITDDKQDITYFIRNRLSLLQDILQKEVQFRPDLSSILLLYHDPHTLKSFILANPQITNDDILLSLNALRSQLEIVNSPHLAQALELRISEIQRLKKVIEPRPSHEQEHPSNYFHAETGGTAINSLQGDLNVFRIERFSQPEKSWWKPMLPKMDKSFVGRTAEIQTLLHQITTENCKGTAIYGMPGVGKTYLAQKVIHDESIHAFFSSFIWLKVGFHLNEESALQALLRNLARHAFGGISPVVDQLDSDLVASWLQEMVPGRLFVVFDDVWSPTLLQQLLNALPSNARFLLTTRDFMIAKRVTNRSLCLETFALNEGLQFLIERLGIQPDTVYRSNLESVVSLLQGHAAALEIAAARIPKPSWIPQILQTLQRHIEKKSLQGLRLPRSTDRNESIEASLSLSYDSMDELTRTRFRLLGSFEPESSITPDAAASIWGTEKEDALLLLQDFANFSLLKVVEEPLLHYYQHSLLHIYTYALLEERKELIFAKWAHASHFSNLMIYADNARPQEYKLIDENIENLLASFKWLHKHEPYLFSVVMVFSAQYFRLRGQGTLLEEYLYSAIEIAKSVGLIDHLPYHLYHLGEIKKKFGNLEHAQLYTRESLELFKQINNVNGQAYALKHLASIAIIQNSFLEAKKHCEQALTLFQLTQDVIGESYIYSTTGLIEQHEGNLEEALMYYLKALCNFQNKNHKLGEAEQLICLGTLELERRNYTQAKEYLDLSLPIFKLERNALGQANVYLALAQMEYLQRKYNQASLYLDQALPLVQAEKNKQGEAHVYHIFGEIEYMRYNRRKAFSYFSQALKLYHAVGMDEELELFIKVAALQETLGETEQAYEHYSLISQMVGTDKYENIAKQLLAGVEEHLGNVDSAAGHYNEALSIAESGQNRVVEASARLSSGHFNGNLGDINHAKEHFEKALNLFTSQGNVSGIASVLLLSGELEQRTGDIQRAREYYSRALQLFQKIGYLNGEASTLQFIGILERECNNFDQARLYFSKAQLIYGQLSTPLEEANLLSEMGDLERRVGETEEAHKHFEKALSIYQKIRNQLGEARALQGIGEVTQSQGRLHEAVDYYDQALDLYSRIHDKQGEARIYRNMGDMFLEERDCTQAKTYYEKSLSLYQIEEDMAGQAYTLIDLGRIRYYLGEQEQGLNDIQQSVLLFKQLQNETWEKMADVRLRIISSEIFPLQERVFFSEEVREIIREYLEGEIILNEISSIDIAKDQLENIERCSNQLIEYLLQRKYNSTLEDFRTILLRSLKWGLELALYLAFQMTTGKIATLPLVIETELFNLVALILQNQASKELIKEQIHTIQSIVEDHSEIYSKEMIEALSIDLAVIQTRFLQE